MRHALPILLLVVGCAGPPAAAPVDGGPIDHEAPDAAAATDVFVDQDTGVRAADSGADIPIDGATQGDAGGLDCSALSPAPCMERADCTLNGGCVDASPNDVPFPFELSGRWSGDVDSEGEAGFPAGSAAVTVSLFRSSDRGIRGVVALPNHGVTHRLWGGVGPTGELGVFLGPAECDACATDFSSAYTAGGVAGEERLDLVDVQKTGIIDFRTFVSLRVTPSDGFKPVLPIAQRDDPLAANWSGEAMIADGTGDAVQIDCVFQIDLDRAVYAFRTFECTEDGPGGAALPDYSAADSDSLASGGDRGWFALGPDDDDLLFVGNVGLDGPWAGVVTRRGGIWASGEPTNPADVPIEAVLGTFKFFGRPTN